VRRLAPLEASCDELFAELPAVGGDGGVAAAGRVAARRSLTPADGRAADVAVPPWPRSGVRSGGPPWVSRSLRTRRPRSAPP
jgi:hypothetical protein